MTNIILQKLNELRNVLENDRTLRTIRAVVTQYLEYERLSR
jgi:hypothetical protein